jgi:prefoldin subunit 5
MVLFTEKNSTGRVMDMSVAAAAARAARVARAQAQLVIERRRRSGLEQDIETLRQSERQMTSVRQEVQSSESSFREASRLEQKKWRGETGNRYNLSRSQSQTNGRRVIEEMKLLIQQVTQEITTLSTRLTAVNNTIRSLEQIVASGGM